MRHLVLVLVLSTVLAVSGASASVGSVPVAGSPTAQPSMLVFASVPGSAPDSVGDLFLVRPDGRGRRPLTRTHAFDELEPAWSPDGRRVAFSRGDPLINAGAFVKDMSAVIVVADVSGANPRAITKPSPTDGGLIDASPSWSPDGRSIAFTRQDSLYLEQPGIYVVGADGRGLHRVAVRTAVAVDWSPDGRSLAFVAGGFETESPGRIGTIDLKTGAVTQFAGAGATDVAWSPSGRTLAVAGNAGITLVTRAGKALRRILAGCRALGVTWSPDGRRLAYGADGGACGPRPSLYVVGADGRGTRRITATGYAPDWRR